MSISFSGDNPVVVEKLKLVSDQRKRQTRSVKNNLEQKQLAKGEFNRPESNLFATLRDMGSGFILINVI